VFQGPGQIGAPGPPPPRAQARGVGQQEDQGGRDSRQAGQQDRPISQRNSKAGQLLAPSCEPGGIVVGSRQSSGPALHSLTPCAPLGTSVPWITPDAPELSELWWRAAAWQGGPPWLCRAGLRQRLGGLGTRPCRTRATVVQLLPSASTASCGPTPSVDFTVGPSKSRAHRFFAQLAGKNASGAQRAVAGGDRGLGPVGQ